MSIPLSLHITNIMPTIYLTPCINFLITGVMATENKATATEIKVNIQKK
jgi:hypothetical protein